MAMSEQMGPKAITCLKIATHEFGSAERVRLFNEAASTYSQKAVLKKFEDLVEAGYVECGVSARSGWITDKGRQALKGQPK